MFKPVRNLPRFYATIFVQVQSVCLPYCYRQNGTSFAEPSHSVKYWLTHQTIGNSWMAGYFYPGMRSLFSRVAFSCVRVGREVREFSAKK